MKVKLYLKKCHEALWNWLAKNPDKDKEDWPGWKTIGRFKRKHLLKEDMKCGMSFEDFFQTLEINGCFACCYSSGCVRCPVAFTPAKKRDCFGSNSYYYDWCSSGMSSEKKSELAKRIAKGWIGEDR